MSEWYEVDTEDVEIDAPRKEFNVLVHDNYAGNVYATIPFYIVKRMYNEILAIEKPNSEVEDE